MNADELRAVREQKLLFKVPIEQQPEFLSLFSTAAHRCLDRSEALYAAQYGSFVHQASRIENALSASLRSLICQLKNYSFSDLLFALDVWLHESYQHISTQVWGRAEPDLRYAQSSIPGLSSVSEEILQNQIGSTNDILFAAACLVNEAAGILNVDNQHGLGSNKRRDLREALPRLVVAANQWNSCVYVIDKVTYGEWRVKEVSAASGAFELVDTRLEFSRIVGLRREAVQRIRKFERGQSGLYVQKQLEKILPHFLEAALDYFSQKCGLEIPLASYWNLRRRLEKRLADLESSDDLLLLAAICRGSRCTASDE